MDSIQMFDKFSGSQQRQSIVGFESLRKRSGAFRLVRLRDKLQKVSEMDKRFSALVTAMLELVDS